MSKSGDALESPLRSIVSKQLSLSLSRARARVLSISFPLPRSLALSACFFMWTPSISSSACLHRHPLGSPVVSTIAISGPWWAQANVIIKVSSRFLRDTLGSTEMMCSGRTGVWSRTEEHLVLSDKVSVFFKRPAFGSFGAATLSRSSGQALALTRTLRARGFQHPYPPGIGFFALFHLQAPGANTTTSYLRP